MGFGTMGEVGTKLINKLDIYNRKHDFSRTQHLSGQMWKLEIILDKKFNQPGGQDKFCFVLIYLGLDQATQKLTLLRL